MAARKPDDDAIVYLYDAKTGWPLGGPTVEQETRAAELRLKFALEAALERLRGGDITAFPEVARLVWKRDPQRVPYELVETSKVLVERAMAEDEKRARREYRIAWTRWEALVELRKRRHELNERGDDRGMTWENAREAVSEMLERTDPEAAGSARTVRESYELIEAAGGERATFETFLEARKRRDERR
jgi:hypothetical protein